PVDDQSWQLMLDGTAYNYAPTAGMNLDQVAAGLDAAVGSATYNVLATGHVLNITRTDGKQFTASVVHGFDKSADVAGTPAMNFTQFELTGTVTNLSVWSIGGATYTANSTDTLQTVASQLAAKLALLGADARVNQYLDLYVIDFDPITGLPIRDTIQRRGVQSLGYLETGFQLYGYAMTNGTGQQLYEDAAGNKVTGNTGKPLFVIDMTNASGGSVPLFLDGLGRFTTTDTGVQALQVTQNSSTLVPFYLGSDGKISNLSTGTRQPASAIVHGVSAVLPLHYDNSGYKATAVPLVEGGVTQRGYQEQGYQAYGYYLYPGGIKSSNAALGAGYTVVVDFDDPKSVALYTRINSIGQFEINTERLANTRFFPPADPATDAAYTQFLATHPTFIGGTPLYEHTTLVNGVATRVVTDKVYEGVQPYIVTYGFGNNPVGTIGDDVGAAHNVVRLYTDPNGNLTTASTTVVGAVTINNPLDWRVGFQRTDASGNPLYLTKPASFQLTVTTSGTDPITSQARTFTLTDGIQTVSLAWNASAAQIDAAVE